MKLVNGRRLEDVVGEANELSERLALLPHILAVAVDASNVYAQRRLAASHLSIAEALKQNGDADTAREHEAAAGAIEELLAKKRD